MAKPPSDQQDTIVLVTDSTVVLPAEPTYPPVSPPPAIPPQGGWQPQGWQPQGWQYVGSGSGSRGRTFSQAAPTAWSRVPPFLPPTTPPVLVMRNNAAVVGATLGSVSLFLALIPIVGLVSLLLAPIGLITSGVGLLVGLARRVGRAGAIWGLLTSGLALLVCLGWTMLFLGL